MQLGSDAKVDTWIVGLRIDESGDKLAVEDW